jgi:hypothetical protein
MTVQTLDDGVIIRAMRKEAAARPSRRSMEEPQYAPSSKNTGGRTFEVVGITRRWQGGKGEKKPNQEKQTNS